MGLAVPVYSSSVVFRVVVYTVALIASLTALFDFALGVLIGLAYALLVFYRKPILEEEKATPYITASGFQLQPGFHMQIGRAGFYTGFDALLAEQSVSMYMHFALELALYFLAIYGFDAVITETNYPMGIFMSMLKILALTGVLIWYREKQYQYLFLGSSAFLIVTLQGSLRLALHHTLINAWTFNLMLVIAVVLKITKRV